MPGKIFARERNEVGEGAQRPRFAVVAAQGADLQLFKTHLRRSELDAIAKAIGAEVVMLPKGSGEHGREHPAGQGGGGGNGGGHGGGHRHGQRHREAEDDAPPA